MQIELQAEKKIFFKTSFGFLEEGRFCFDFSVLPCNSLFICPTVYSFAPEHLSHLRTLQIIQESLKGPLQCIYDINTFEPRMNSSATQDVARDALERIEKIKCRIFFRVLASLFDPAGRIAPSSANTSSWNWQLGDMPEPESRVMC